MPPVTLPLPASRSYAVREIVWTRVTRVGFRVGGVLQVNERRTKTGKLKTRRYAVQEDTPESGCRRFRVTKPLSELKADDAPYYVTLEPNGMDACVCHAYLKTGHCTHRQAMRVLCGAGHLDPDRIPAPAAEPATPSDANKAPLPGVRGAGKGGLARTLEKPVAKR